jgi:hypothetical protein
MSTQAARHGAHRKANGGAIRQTLHKNEQERRSRPRGDLRSSRPTEHALCADQEHRTAGGVALYRARQGFVSARTAQVNQIRGLLSAYGIVIPQGIAHIAGCAPEIIEDASNKFLGLFRQLVQRLRDTLGMTLPPLASRREVQARYMIINAQWTYPAPFARDTL